MIKVICSRCGGKGTLKFLYFKKPHWRKETCPVCKGLGYVEEESFQERKEAEKDANNRKNA